MRRETKRPMDRLLFGWPAISHASAQLCRPQLRLVEPLPEIRLETSAVLSLAAISVDEDEVAVDGLLDSAAAGTTLDINGLPVRVHRSGEFSTAFDPHERRALTVTLALPLVKSARANGEVEWREEPA